MDIMVIFDEYGFPYNFIKERINMADDEGTVSDFLINNTIIGDPKKAVGSSIRGIHKTVHRGPVRRKVEAQGYLFMTRPQLNLSKDNLIASRNLLMLTENRDESIVKAVRLLFDPALSKVGDSDEDLTSPLVDDESVWLTPISNFVITMSGWPSTILPTKTTNPGLAKEQMAYGDGLVEMYQVWEADVSFKSDATQVVELMLKIWSQYISDVHKNLISPYMAFLLENEMDYNSRAIRLVMDKDNKIVEKILSTQGVFPVNRNDGAAGDMNLAESPIRVTADTRVRFKCVGAEINDPVLPYEFNQLSAQFSPQLTKLLKGESGHGLIKIPSTLMDVVDGRAYPWINLDTMELEWWIKEDVLQKI